MTALVPLTVDVHPDLRSGGEPLPRILQAVARLQPDQPLRLLTTFEPTPLYAALGRKGFGHAASRRGAGDWEILFTPNGPSSSDARGRRPAPNHAAAASTAVWPPPSDFLDNRGLQPPEPMSRILEALEHLASGEVLEAITEREPMLLYPELAARGAEIRGEKQPEGAVRLLIRRGS